MTILTLLVMSVGGRIGAWLAGLLSQPSVLGELLIGVALGATPWFVGADADPAISLVAQAGAVLLLFEAGIECDMASLVSVARSSLLVAITGVVASMAAGFAASLYFQPTAPWITHWFVAGILCSTGAGVTARVLKDLGKTQSTEGHVILGAAVIDDVLGLLVMAVLLDTSGAPLRACLDAPVALIKINHAEFADVCAQNLATTADIIAAARAKEKQQP